MAVHQHLGGALRVAFRLLEHGELIGIHRLILIHCGLDMPAREVAAIAPGKRPGSKAADRDTLPVAVIDITGYARHSWIFERKSQWAFPCSFWNIIASRCGGSCG